VCDAYVLLKYSSVAAPNSTTEALHAPHACTQYTDTYALSALSVHTLTDSLKHSHPDVSM